MDRFIRLICLLYLFLVNPKMNYGQSDSFEVSVKFSIDDRMFIADTFFSKGNYKEAMENYEAAQQSVGLDAERLEKLGYSCSQAKEMKKAIYYLTMAIDKNPKLITAYSHRGYAYMMQRMHQESILDFKYFLSKNPDDAMSHFTLGMVFELDGNFKEALKAYILALKNNNGFSEAQFKIGQMSGKLGNFQDALKSFDAAINMNPNNGEYYLNRGKAKGKLKLAFCDDFKKAIDLGNKDAIIMVNKFCK